jgi:rare lipoprotein A (peptidoglycan hydrolase)
MTRGRVVAARADSSRPHEITCLISRHPCAACRISERVMNGWVTLRRCSSPWGVCVRLGGIGIEREKGVNDLVRRPQMKLTIFALSISMLLSVTARAADDAGYIRFDRLEEVVSPEPTRTATAPGQAKLSHAVVVEGAFAQPNCDCKQGGRRGLLTPFLEFVKASKTSRRRPARALTCGTFEGEASWYTARKGAPMANGQGFDATKPWAAHKTLPFGTVVTVHCPSGRNVDVTIKDDGPHIAGRIIDLTKASADQCGITSRGHAKVTIEVKCPTSLAREAAPATDAPPASEPEFTPEPAPGLIVPSDNDGVDFGNYPIS